MVLHLCSGLGMPQSGLRKTGLRKTGLSLRLCWHGLRQAGQELVVLHYERVDDGVQHGHGHGAVRVEGWAERREGSGQLGDTHI